jgi:hypothetical protein
MDHKKLQDDPARFVVPDPLATPWTNDADLRLRGGVLLWNAGVFGDELPSWSRKRFPEALTHEPIELPFAAGSTQRLRVGWATIAPDGYN